MRLPFLRLTPRRAAVVAGLVLLGVAIALVSHRLAHAHDIVKVERTLSPGHDCSAVAWSPDQKYLACSAWFAAMTTVYETAGWTVAARLPKHSNTYPFLAFLPDDRLIAGPAHHEDRMAASVWDLWITGITVTGITVTGITVTGLRGLR